MNKIKRMLLVVMAVLIAVAVASCSKQPETVKEEVTESPVQAEEAAEPQKAVDTNELYHIACEKGPSNIVITVSPTQTDTLLEYHFATCVEYTDGTIQSSMIYNGNASDYVPAAEPGKTKIAIDTSKQLRHALIHAYGYILNGSSYNEETGKYISLGDFSEFIEYYGPDANAISKVRVESKGMHADNPSNTCLPGDMLFSFFNVYGSFVNATENGGMAACLLATSQDSEYAEEKIGDLTITISNVQINDKDVPPQEKEWIIAPNTQREFIIEWTPESLAEVGINPEEISRISMTVQSSGKTDKGTDIQSSVDIWVE